MDLQIFYDNTQQMFDLELNSTKNMFLQTKDIETLIQVQLFTDQDSWWGDDIGSSLYKLTTLDQTKYAQYGESYCKNALKFLTDYKLCKSYDCTCSFNNQTGQLEITITCEYNNGIKKEYEYVWDGV